MVELYVGQSAVVTASFTDQEGDPSDPTTVTLQVTSPSGATATYTFGTDANVTNTGTGDYSGLFAITEGGDWVYRWRGVTGSYTPTVFGRITAVPVFSYGGNPAASSRDAVRFLIGDTDVNDVQLRDAEIDWLLSQNSDNAQQAAIAACRGLIAKYARLVDTQVDDVRESASQAHKQFVTLLGQMQAQASETAWLGAMPFAGGISLTQKATAEADTDRVPPIFTRDAQVVSPSLPFTGGTNR